MRHYNPYRLELTLARLVAWAAYVLLAAWVVACIADAVDNLTIERQLWIGVAIFAAGAIAAGSEQKAEEKAVEFELKMRP